MLSPFGTGYGLSMMVSQAYSGRMECRADFCCSWKRPTSAPASPLAISMTSTCSPLRSLSWPLAVARGSFSWLRQSGQRVNRLVWRGLCSYADSGASISSRYRTRHSLTPQKGALPKRSSVLDYPDLIDDMKRESELERLVASLCQAPIRPQCTGRACMLTVHR